MSDKKNIDRLFQEKFKDFEAEPNDAVWNRISDSLAGKKKKRRIIPIWWQLGGVAAVIALLLTVGVSVFNSGSDTNQDLPVVNTDKVDTNSNSNITDVDKNSADEVSGSDLNTNIDNTSVAGSDSNSSSNSNANNTEDKAIQKGKESKSLTTPNKLQSQSNNAVASNSTKNKNISSQKLNTLKTNSDKENTKVATNTKSSNTTSKNIDEIDDTVKNQMQSDIDKNIKNSKNSVADNTPSNASESKNSDINKKISEDAASKPLIENLDRKQSIEDAIAENTNPIIEKEEEEKLNRWSIAPNVAPVYFSSLGKGSSIDPQFNENSKSSDINMSYGIAGSYALSKKIKIRTGVNRVNLSRTTSDVLSFTGPASTARGINAQFSNITFKDGIQTISIISAQTIDRSSAPETFNTMNTGDVNQRFGFLEVPLEIEYRLLDKKFGVNVVGGFSTFFLNENEIYAEVDGNSTFIGEANNINSTSFSANFGLGLDYSLSKQWNINLEPTFKYQINTFNNTSGDFRPFFIGVYTGLSFKF